MDRTSAGATLRKVRRDRDLSQVALERLAGVRLRTVTDIECGRNRNPSWAIVGRLAAALDMDPRDLFPLEHFPLDRRVAA